MSKQRKKGGKVTDSTLNLTTALINLVTAILLLLEKFTEYWMQLWYGWLRLRVGGGLDFDLYLDLYALKKSAFFG